MIRPGLGRQSAITAVVALAGVATGLLLDLAWWHRLGLGDASDAVALALRLPVGLAAIVVVLGGQVLVPTFATWATTFGPRDDARAMAGVLVWVVAGAAAVALLIATAAGPLMHVLSPHWAPAKLDLAASLTRVLAAYVPLLAAAEVFRSWLTARLVIGAPAVMSLLLNVTGIPVILFGPPSVTTVGIAYAAGSLVQVAAMASLAWRHGWRPARPAPREEAVRHTVSLFARPSLGAGLNPVMRVVEGIVVSFLPTGSATFVHYGNRLAGALGGTIVFRSVMVALVPRLATAAGRGDESAFAALTRSGVRLLALAAIPMSLLGIVLAARMTDLVFGLGRPPGSVKTLGALMAIYAVSFAGSGLQRALLAPFYALRDTRTPLRNTVYGAVANSAILLGGFPLVAGSPHAIALIPVAYSAAQYVNVAHAYARARRLPGMRTLGLAPAVAGSLLVGLPGAAMAWLVLRMSVGRQSVPVLALACVVGLGLSVAVGILARRRLTAGTARGPTRGPTPGSTPGPTSGSTPGPASSSAPGP